MKNGESDQAPNGNSGRMERESKASSDNGDREKHSPEKSQDGWPAKLDTLLAFSKRSRNFILGRESIYRKRHQLHFVLATQDLSENSRKEILYKFQHYPVVRFGKSESICNALGIHGAKVIGFTKGGLSKSLYEILKPHRINRPVIPASTDTNPEQSSESPPSKLRAKDKTSQGD